MSANSHQVFAQQATGPKAAQLELAAANVRAILKSAPEDANCLHVIGLIECQLGRLESATTWIEKSLAVRPHAAEVQCHYAMILMERKKYAQAIAVFKRALSLAPNSVDAHYHLGNAFNETGQFAEASAAFQLAISLKPDHAEALNNLGNIINNHGNAAEAIPLYRRAIAANPAYAMAWNNMGLAYTTLGELETAKEHFRQALALNPDYPEAHNNLGIAFRLEGNFEESTFWYNKALALRPDYPDALNNLGNALKDLGHIKQAIALYEKAISLKESADYRHNLAIALLMLGRFKEGWREYEWRWKMGQLSNAHRQFTQPQWFGEAAEGKTLLIHAEQGFGDTLQFCRFASMAKARGLRIILEVQPALVKLIQSLEGVDQVIAQGQPLPDFDLHCPTLSLPLAFGTTVETIPAQIPYLAANETAVAAWREKLPATQGALRVGLVWAGSSRLHSPDLVATDRRRSVAPETFAPLLDVPGVQFYNLQKTGPQAPASFGLIDFMPECRDFADTAALVAYLDLVITVDTAIAHLAGAMGKPVWVLNRFDSCWRWLQDRDDSPWYPTLRLFHQTKPGDWASVVARLSDALASLASEKVTQRESAE